MKTILKFILALLPYGVFALLYFSMKFFPSYEYNTIDIRGLYDAEQALCGFLPCEYFSMHNCAVLDFIAGISYLCWVPVPVAFTIILFMQKRYRWCVHTSLCFLLCNLIGFCIYYAHPAAPPWYAMQFGFEPIINTPGSAAGLVRFDELIGMKVFQSIYTGNSNIFAAIPSLHAAYMLITTIYAVLSRQSKWMITVFTMITLGIWFTAVYTAHHNVIDVLLGIATATVSVILFETTIAKTKFVDKYSKAVG